MKDFFTIGNHRFQVLDRKFNNRYNSQQEEDFRVKSLETGEICKLTVDLRWKNAQATGVLYQTFKRETKDPHEWYLMLEKQNVPTVIPKSR